MFLLACTLAVAAPAGADGERHDRLTVTADAATLNVLPRAAGRRFLELPTLEYRFRVQAACGNDARPTSVSVTVADSRVTLPAKQFDAEQAAAVHEVTLGIPATQLPPVAIDRFCASAPTVTGDTGEVPLPEPLPADAEITISAALSAHASLLCSSGSEQKMTYVTTPLDLRLVCEVPATGTPVPQ